MNPACHPISVLPHLSRLFTDALAVETCLASSPLRRFYPVSLTSAAWMQRAAAPAVRRDALADLLKAQADRSGAGARTLAGIQALREGAPAVVTGQQVGLFGGPLLTLLKAATAVARAEQAGAATGIRHVPVFWLATEDHDLAEVDQAAFPSPHGVETLSLRLRSHGEEVGGLELGPDVAGLLDRVDALLGYAPIGETLRRWYTPSATLGSAFGGLLTTLFAEHGLVVMDASGRSFHTLGQPVFRAAIERAAELEEALLARGAELGAAGYHAQVLVKPGASLLFLLERTTGVRNPLRRAFEKNQRPGAWKAGAQSYTSAELLEIVDREPERISPNALLRPLFQDTLLSTAAYIGGPAEIAYFAQSAVLYERLLGRVTPILPRFSATLVSPSAAAVMARHELTLPDLFAAETAAELTQRLGARAMPIEGKRKLAAAGNALDRELSALTGYLEAVDASLGRSAGVAASKMRYQMNRLRRLAARFETEKEASLARHAAAVMLELYPDRHPQERRLAGVWFLAQAGEPAELIARLVEAARDTCPGHTVISL